MSGNFPFAAVDKLEQIWADKSHFACSNLARMTIYSCIDHLGTKWDLILNSLAVITCLGGVLILDYVIISMLFWDHKVNETCSLIHGPCPPGFILIVIFQFDGNNITKVAISVIRGEQTSSLCYTRLYSALSESSSSAHLVLSCGAQSGGLSTPQ